MGSAGLALASVQLEALLHGLTQGLWLGLKNIREAGGSPETAPLWTEGGSRVEVPQSREDGSDPSEARFLLRPRLGPENREALQLGGLDQFSLAGNHL